MDKSSAGPVGASGGGCRRLPHHLLCHGESQAKTHLAKSVDVINKLVQSLMTNHHLVLHEMFPVVF